MKKCVKMSKFWRNSHIFFSKKLKFWRFLNFSKNHIFWILKKMTKNMIFGKIKKRQNFNFFWKKSVNFIEFCSFSHFFLFFLLSLSWTKAVGLQFLLSLFSKTLSSPVAAVTQIASSVVQKMKKKCENEQNLMKFTVFFSKKLTFFWFFQKSYFLILWFFVNS